MKIQESPETVKLINIALLKNFYPEEISLMLKRKNTRQMKAISFTQH